MAARRATTPRDRPLGRPAPGRDTLGARVGARLRERRTELGRTLRNVAAAADVSVSYLSAVENGGNVPSLPVLGRISHALELTIADVLRGESQSHVRREHPETGRPGARRISHDQLQLEIRFVVMEGDRSGASPVDGPGRDVFVYVREGSVTLTVDGTEYELRVGDALDAAAPERLTWRAGPSGAVTVWASGMPRDR